jgi:phosphohistidine phosphatase
MDIYIVRHAIAEDGSPGMPDERRALTADGKRKMKEAAAGFARLKPDVQKIFASPLVRARQTAEIVATELEKEVAELKELSPGYAPASVVAKLQKMTDVQSIMLVGHEPNCSELASYLLSQKSNADLEFKKGAICIIRTDSLSAGAAILLAHYPPAALRAMKK